MPQDNCQYKNPLTLKGTAQESRAPKYLDPDLVKIDGKSKEDYQRILQELAELVVYYSGRNKREGQWSEFFTDEQLKRSGPHVALFHAFLEMIQYAQDDMNAITAKHLEFYYKEVLQIASKAETEDQAHVLFELANNLNSYIVEKGTLLKAGKDINGKPRHFITEDEIVVNKATISEVKSVFVDANDAGREIVYASPIANSSNGIGGDLNEENPVWPPFGVEQNAQSKLTIPHAGIGFAVASSFLLLPDGERVITVTLNFSDNIEINDEFNKKGILISFSGIEGWIIAESLELDSSDAVEDNQLVFNITIPLEEEAIVEYSEELYGEHFNTNVPVMKFAINQIVSPNLYSLFTGVTIDSIDLSVNVSGAKDLILQNESGVLDASKPFEPFGFSPSLESEFYIGSKAIFSKPLSSLALSFEWLDKPVFNTHYSAYTGSGNTVNDLSFEVKVKGLKNKKWTGNRLHEKKRIGLFNSPIILSDERFKSVFDKLDEVKEIEEFNNTINSGFIRLELLGPSSKLIAFGHGQYQNLLIQTTINNAKGSCNENSLPNEPWTPKAKSLTIDYSSSHSIRLNDSIETESDRMFHIGPFGICRKKAESGKTMTLLPKYDKAGEFYIGLDQLEVPQNLNLLFQVAEGSANPSLTPETIQWSYLNSDAWYDLKDVEILKDSTNGLLNSGIISFSLPKTLSNNNYWLKNGLFWLRASIKHNPDSVSQLINVHTQAVTARFQNNHNELSHLENALEAETISKLRETDSSIRKVSQPYASFGGRLPEENESYYRRVSERLRHKNRAITIWDYERIILEEFPSVYKVKCLNHTRMSSPYSEQAPGHVSVVVISNLRNQNQLNLLEPTTSVGTLKSIERFLEDKKNPFASIHVENPDFEQIQVDFKVRFHDWVDKGAYKLKLNEDIKRHLSPWAFEEGADLSFDGVIHKSVIIDFIEELDYVNYVACFKMYHIMNNTEGLEVGRDEDVNSAEPSRASALLVSCKDHLIEILINDDCSCEEGSIQNQVVTDGVGSMSVGNDFIVNKP